MYIILVTSDFPVISVALAEDGVNAELFPEREEAEEFAETYYGEYQIVLLEE
jgi:hypothetical protein